MRPPHAAHVARALPILLALGTAAAGARVERRVGRRVERRRVASGVRGTMR